MLPAVASLFHVNNCKADASRLIFTMRDVIKFIFRPSCSFACASHKNRKVRSVVDTEFLESWARALHNIRDKVSIFIEVLTQIFPLREQHTPRAHTRMAPQNHLDETYLPPRELLSLFFFVWSQWHQFDDIYLSPVCEWEASRTPLLATMCRHVALWLCIICIATTSRGVGGKVLSTL